MPEKISKQVELRAAKIPFIGNVAVHYWLVIFQDSYIDRWEVWQSANRCQSSWGHLHKNLLHYNQGVGNGSSWVEYTWQGETANLLTTTIENTPQIYPYNYLYRYWPGPNSNTYVQWVLDQVKINYYLGPLGIGKNYHIGKRQKK